MKKKYIDLFAGCGGLSLGLHFAGWSGAFAIEKNADAFDTLKYNLIEKEKHFDWPDWLPQTNHNINTIINHYSKELKALRGSIDMVVGGPPCQGFSMAGRRNEKDTRNNLVDSYIEFVNLVKPKMIFFENVKGFTMEFKKNKDKGIAYSTYVTKKLESLGYDVHGKLVDFSQYGVPQKRTRFILIGVQKKHLKKKHTPKTFFKLLESNRFSFLANVGLKTTNTLEDAISDLLKGNGTWHKEKSTRFNYGKYSTTESAYQSFMRLRSTSLHPNSHRFANHTQIVEERFENILTIASRNKDLNKDIRTQYNIKKHTIIPLAPQLPSPTLTTLPDDYIHYLEPRILTVREYARIQSFPDNYIFKGKYTTGGKRRVLEVPRYTQIGNAIPPLFAEQSGIILQQLIK